MNKKTIERKSVQLSILDPCNQDTRMVQRSFDLSNAIQNTLAQQASPREKVQNLADTILGAVSDFGISRVELRLPNLTLFATLSDTTTSLVAVAKFGAWEEGELLFFEPANPQNATVPQPFDVALSLAVQTRIFSLALQMANTEVEAATNAETAYESITKDALTGVLNRKGFMQKLEEAVGNLQFGAEFALHMLDIDDFKPINDTYGHAIGDAFLTGIVNAIVTKLNVSHAFARVGGDEFCIIHSGANAIEQISDLGMTIGDALLARKHTQSRSLSRSI